MLHQTIPVSINNSQRILMENVTVANITNTCGDIFMPFKAAEYFLAASCLALPYHLIKAT
jgi:hypothetical protein